MMKNFLLFILSVFILSCQSQKTLQNSKKGKTDKIYQYSLFTALANKIYDGTITVSQVKEKGDLGLGTFNGLNGEMIVLDGEVYQWLADGTLFQAKNSQLVPFTVVTFFEADQTINLKQVSSYDELKSKIAESLPSENLGYAFKIEGKFNTLTCASANKQNKPFTKTLSEALVDRPVFKKENVSGTMVGFWYPEYIGKVNIPGFHLHFISDDRTLAGHVIEFEASGLKVGIDYCNGFDVDLPETKEFIKARFDLSQEYSKKK